MNGWKFVYKKKYCLTICKTSWNCWQCSQEYHKNKIGYFVEMGQIKILFNWLLLVSLNSTTRPSGDSFKNNFQEIFHIRIVIFASVSMFAFSIEMVYIYKLTDEVVLRGYLTFYLLNNQCYRGNRNFEYYRNSNNI